VRGVGDSVAPLDRGYVEEEMVDSEMKMELRAGILIKPKEKN
jgi:hypothetical protein